MRTPNDGARVEPDLMNSGAGEFAGLWPKQVMAAHGWNGIGTGSPVQSTGGAVGEGGAVLAVGDGLPVGRRSVTEDQFTA